MSQEENYCRVVTDAITYVVAAEILRHVPTGFIVWDFCDAPPELRALSDNGGDEDWLAIVSGDRSPWLHGWLQHLDFGAEPDVVLVKPQYSQVEPIFTSVRVYIGSHA